MTKVNVKMKVAYVLATNMASSYKLASMILPQLEQGTHGADVIGIFFFDDNLFCLRKGDAVGERLALIAKRKNILLMVCDMCAVRRGLAVGTLDQCGSGAVQAQGLVDRVVAGCFPQFYSALGGSPPDYVITL
ncbi:MAG TPA: SaoD/DsrE family protein [Acidobacteriaceae bacterium]|nr:SaoD/DsrE family protein [Acidobacteriaceae bacterium]